MLRTLSAVLVALLGAVGYFRFVHEPAVIVEPKAPAQQAPTLPVVPARVISSGLPDDGDWRGKCALADFDRDGDLDLVASIRRWSEKTMGEGVHVWLNDGAGKWRAHTDGMRRDMGYGGADVADVNGDGLPDIAFSGHDVSPHVFINCFDDADFKGWATTADGIELSTLCADVALGDFDGDRKIDLAAIGMFPARGGLFVFRGDGAGGFTKSDDLLPALNFGAQIRAVDVDGDGKSELIGVTDTGPRVWRGLADGGFADMSEGFTAPSVGGSLLGIVAEDFDGDGHREILVAGVGYEHAGTAQPAVAIYRRNGDRWEPWGSGLPATGGFFDACVARFEPGRTSLVLASKPGLVVLDMVAPGEFRTRGLVPNTAGVLNTCAGDIDGDGRDEVVFVGFGGVRVLDLDQPE